VERRVQHAAERERGATVKVALHHAGELDFFPACAIAFLAKAGNVT